MLNRLGMCTAFGSLRFLSIWPTTLLLQLVFQTVIYTHARTHTHKHSHWFDALTASAIDVCFTQFKSTRVFGFRTRLLITLLSTILLSYVLCAHSSDYSVCGQWVCNRIVTNSYRYSLALVRFVCYIVCIYIYNTCKLLVWLPAYNVCMYIYILYLVILSFHI